MQIHYPAHTDCAAVHITHGFIKRQQRTPLHEIDRAAAIAEYLHALDREISITTVPAGTLRARAVAIDTVAEHTWNQLGEERVSGTRSQAALSVCHDFCAAALAMPTTMELEELSQALDLRLVYTAKLFGERQASGEVDDYNLALNTLYATFTDRIDYLFEATCAVAGDNAQIAEVQTSIVCSFESELDPRGLPHELIEHYGSRVATFTAYPYIRQSIQDIAARLLISGLSIGMLKRGHPAPFIQTQY